MHHFIKNAFFLCLVGFSLMQCINGKKDIRNYYFPLKKLTEGLVYEYRPVGNDSITPVYWYYRSLINKEGAYLTGTYYEYNFEPLQFVREELVKNGMLLQDINLYQYDTISPQPMIVDGEILSGTTYPFEVSEEDGGIFLYKVKFAFSPEIQATIIKNRKYLGETTFEWEGEIYDAVEFEVKELVEYDDTKAGGIEPEFSGSEIYAKGLGLVYYKKDLGAGSYLEYRLHKTYLMEELEAQFDQYLDQKE